MKFFEFIGQYVLFLRGLFSRPEKFRVFKKQLLLEMENIGLGSFGIVSLISTFTGAVSTIQIGYQLVSGLVPEYLIGRIVRDSNILEFSPTVTCLVLAGKVGSSIASEIGTMKVTEQVDALEIMGVNSANYLVLPKIFAGLFTIPLLVIYAMFLSLLGGALSGSLSGIINLDFFVKGLRADFIPFSVTFSMIKAFTFAFIITSVSSFHGYKTEGGALEVGQSSTKAVVYSCMGIIFFDYIISELFLKR
ncbi:MAG: MlaE family ABC transporter permease [Bacteroidota bacterium]|jgi:phospholipid/cholesterol/gamma-HCH transport system permease protein|nr:ABC transporter permease [Sphingobacteriales bacterium]